MLDLPTVRSERPRRVCRGIRGAVFLVVLRFLSGAVFSVLPGEWARRSQLCTRFSQLPGTASSSWPQLSLTGSRGSLTDEDVLEAVSQAIQWHPALLFMKGSPSMPQCGFSARVVDILRELGVAYEHVNVLDERANPGVREAVKVYSNWPTLPQLFVGGQFLGGADIISELFESGDLERHFQQGTAASVDSGATLGDPVEGTVGGRNSRGRVLLVNDPLRPVATLISSILSQSFDLHALRVDDESSDHEGDAGALEMGLTSESHFSLLIVSPEFAGLSSVERQQKVFSALSDVMPRIHAMSLVTKTPAEHSGQR